MYQRCYWTTKYTLVFYFTPLRWRTSHKFRFNSSFVTNLDQSVQLRSNANLFYFTVMTQEDFTWEENSGKLITGITNKWQQYIILGVTIFVHALVHLTNVTWWLLTSSPSKTPSLSYPRFSLAVLPSIPGSGVFGFFLLLGFSVESSGVPCSLKHYGEQ